VLGQLGADFPFMAWAHDAGGTLLDANPAWQAGTGLGPATGTMPQLWQRLMPAYDLVRHLGTFGAALRAGVPYAFEHRLKPERAGTADYRWYLTRAAPVRAGGEHGLIWIGTTIALPGGAAGERHHDSVDPGVAAAARTAEAVAGPPEPTVRPPEPMPLPQVAGARLDAAVAGSGSGAGWYDAFVLPDGRLVLSVGDLIGDAVGAETAGRGTDAVTPAMLRNTIRGAALACPAPDAVLAAAHAALALEGSGRQATALVALYDPRTRLLAHARAGHPPALLHDGAEAVELAARPRLPLGRPDRTAAELRTVRLRPGAVVRFCTAVPPETLGQPGGTGGGALLARTAELDGTGEA
jgi:Stage II sporulation protein E (SpoIIE)